MSNLINKRNMELISLMGRESALRYLELFRYAIPDLFEKYATRKFYIEGGTSEKQEYQNDI